MRWFRQVVPRLYRAPPRSMHGGLGRIGAAGAATPTPLMRNTNAIGKKRDGRASHLATKIHQMIMQLMRRPFDMKSMIFHDLRKKRRKFFFSCARVLGFV